MICNIIDTIKAYRNRTFNFLVYQLLNGGKVTRADRRRIMPEKKIFIFVINPPRIIMDENRKPMIHNIQKSIVIAWL